ncbi:TauD/TfdA dioxygenase family protein [Pyruvatibacter mobilis]|uniref:TauD/TfdA dioxygenase family protein n=1 Tax=Pyruvatibacter mobilis TaxID=1712261 RepID=UPI003C7E8619
MGQSWDVKRLAGTLGAEVTGIRLAEIGAEETDAVKALLSQHKVLLFPDQHLSPDEHVALGQKFGELEGAHPNLAKPGMPSPHIFELKATEGGIADEWHTDLTFTEHPPLMSILNMVACPEAGGDTMWTDLIAAYNDLSEPMQEMLDGLTALHDARPHGNRDAMAIHPVVRVHPTTGEKALYVNEHFTRRIVEMNPFESEALLAFLTRWVQNPRFTVRLHWTEGAIGMWDNRVTQHFVINDFVGERVIQRVTVLGDDPQGAGAPRWRPWTERATISATSHWDAQLYRFLRDRDSKQAAE